MEGGVVVEAFLGEPGDGLNREGGALGVQHQGHGPLLRFQNQPGPGAQSRQGLPIHRPATAVDGSAIVHGQLLSLLARNGGDGPPDGLHALQIFREGQLSILRPQ